MKGWVKIINSIHGTAYFRDIYCCENSILTKFKSKNVKSRNSREDYYKCEKCGQIIMERHQEFICTHSKSKKTNDLCYSVYVKKMNEHAK